MPALANTPQTEPTTGAACTLWAAELPLALYVHLPWCERKCPYCDFNSHAGAVGELLQARYLRALATDLEQSLPLLEGRVIGSVFIGGGTPSLFSAASIDTLLRHIRTCVPLAPDAEISLEANPGSADARHFSAYREAGVNRLSLGIQSLHEPSLQALGRTHGRHEAQAAIHMAQAAGFDNLNLDLMYGLPGQDMAQALADLDQALAHAPTHLSWYQLTIEPNTAFAFRPPQLPPETQILRMQAAGAKRLAAAGLEQYEVSAWAAGPDRHCRHNRNYWEFGDYLGLGAGAHSKLGDARGRVHRQARHRTPERYMRQAQAGHPISDQWTLDPADLILEFFLNGLRLCEGVTLEHFRQRTGLDPECVRPRLTQAQRAGLLQCDGRQVRPTPRGQRFLNDLLQYFMPDS